GAKDLADGRKDRGYEVVVVDAECDFRSSARFDDALGVWVRLAHMGNSSFGFEFRIVKGDTLVCEVMTRQCAIDRASRQPIALPDDFKNALRSFEASLHPK